MLESVQKAFSMWRWAIAAAIIAFILLTVLIRHRLHRRRLLAELAAQRQQDVDQFPVTVQSSADRHSLAEMFHRDFIIRIDDFVSADCLRSLRSEAERSVPYMTPSFIPTHKKGRTLSYEKIHSHAPGCLGFYHSPIVQDWVSTIVGMPIFPTPDGDQSSLSILCYKEKGDHINWHYDHNFYRGRHFTVLLSLANESATGELSQSNFVKKHPDGQEQVFCTAPNTLVIFEGARVLHKASPTADGDLRMMLSMTYCADPRTNWIKEFARRVKDTAFYGIRALWD